MPIIQYECTYKFSKRLDVFWRLAIWFPSIIFIATYILREEITFPIIYLIISGIIVSMIIILAKNYTYKWIKRNDIYSFTVDNEKISSIHPIEWHEMNFMIPLDNIQSLSTGSLSSNSPSWDFAYANYLIHTYSGQTYNISRNFIDSPLSACKVINRLLKSKR